MRTSLGRGAPAAGVFLASRLATIAAAAVTQRITRVPNLTDVLARWDGDWYMRIVISGYPREVPPGAGNPAQSSIAFFPAYPLSMKGLAAVTGLAPETWGVLISMLAGTAAAVVIWFLVARLADEAAATRAVALFSFFPGAFAFTMVYADALFVLAAAACLLALVSERWMAAGLAAAVAGATRPNGLVLGACCLWVALPAVRRLRSARPLAAPLLAPAGAVAFLAYLYAHTGDPLVWVRAQGRGWGQRVDFGLSAARKAAGVALDPLGDVNLLSATITLAFVVVAFLLLLRWRPPGVLAVYSAGIVAPLVLSAAFPLTPRSAAIAFPLVAATARVLRGSAYLAAVGLSAAVMAALLALTGSTIFLTP